MTGFSRRPPPDGGAAVEGYLAAISARLPGPAWARSGITAELRSGLLDATDAHRAAGLPPAEATAAAIGEFGDPALVADGFTAEIAARLARRVAVILLVTGPLVGVLWLSTAFTSHLGIYHVPPWEWQNLSGAVRAAIRLLVVPVGVTVWAALFGIASTGRLTRWLPAAPRRAATAGAVAGFAAVGADALGLTLFAAQLTVAPGTLAPIPAAAAATASIVRLVLARRAAHRCLVIRASLA
jgi:hypothetical protein